MLFLFSVEQIQLDFVEILRVRDEKRRTRHVEMLRRQKEEEEDEEEACTEGARVEIPADMDEGSVLPSVKATARPQPPLRTASGSPTNSSGSNTSIYITSRPVRLESRVAFHQSEVNMMLSWPSYCNSTESKAMRAAMEGCTEAQHVWS